MEKRGANFTKSEINILIDIALKYKHIIENKKTDGTTTQGKNKTWDLIAEEFNGASGNFACSSKTIRTKYDAVKKDLRKKCSKLRCEQLKTGGGLPDFVDLSTYEEKILSVCKTSMIGLNSTYDDDGAQFEEPLTRPKETANIQIELLDDDREEHTAYLQSHNQAYELIDCEGPSCSTQKLPVQSNMEIPAASSKLIADENLSCKRKASSSFDKYMFKDNKKGKTSERRQKENRSEVTADVTDLKKKLLQMQIDLVQKEIEQKETISALTIENLLLDQAIKKAQLRKLE